ncbi:MAG: amidase family protein [Caldilineaceae bacterium]
MDTIFASTTQMAAAIQVREISAVELLDAHLAQIEKQNPALNAIVTLNADAARNQARAADAALARGECWGALHGVPFTLKDSFATAGMRTTTGFPPLDHVPNEDSTVSARLKAAGGILMGKTNVATMLGDPGQSENPIFGRTNNPWNPERTPGGSSGGAAAAVAAGMTPFEIGTDLAGSIRIPAHFCGVYGLKPTENRVSAEGLIPGLPPGRSIRIMSSIGPLARTVQDLTLLYRLIAGPDGRDMEVQPIPIDAAPALDLRQLHIAVAPALAGLPVANSIRQAIVELATQLQQAGAVVEEATLPTLDYQQMLANAGELIGMMIGAFQPEAQTNPTTLAHYLMALHQRDQAIMAWEHFFAQWDALLCPPAMTNAFAHCESGASLMVDGQAFPYWLINAHTTLFNYTGHPALVMPYTLDHNGLPIGVQLVGKRWGEARLLATAQAVEQVSGGFHQPAGC